MAGEKHVLVVEDCVEYLVGMDLIGGLEGAWYDALYGHDGLDFYAVSMGTKYLELVDPRERVGCFRNLRFAPKAEKFVEWARAHGVMQDLAGSLEWSGNEHFPLFNDGSKWLALVEGGCGGISCADLSKLEAAGLRLGPNQMLGVWPKSAIALEDVLPDEFVMQVNKMYEGGFNVGSLADDFDNLVKLTEKRAQYDCVFDRLPTAYRNDVDEFGDAALLGAGSFSEAVGVERKAFVEQSGPFISLRDAVLCYVDAFVHGDARGVRVIGDARSMGVLVCDPAVSVDEGLRCLLRRWEDVKCADTNVVAPSISVPQREMFDMLEKGFESQWFVGGTYSVKPRGEILWEPSVPENYHTDDPRCLGSLSAGDILCTFQLAFRRFLHAKGLCRESDSCECVIPQLTLRKGGTWVVAGDFEYEKKKGVKALNSRGLRALTMMLPEQSRPTMSSWLDPGELSFEEGEERFVDQARVISFTRGGGCRSCEMIRMCVLRAWIAFLRVGTLRMSDVVWYRSLEQSTSLDDDVNLRLAMMYTRELGREMSVADLSRYDKDSGTNFQFEMSILHKMGVEMLE